MDRPTTLPVEDILAPSSASPGIPGEVLGYSREGRPILGRVFGKGDLHLSLIGGCHADEPVGPAMLRRLSSYLDSLPPGHPLLARATWHVVPHVNPDGEARNAAWSETTLPAVDSRGQEDRAFDVASYLRHVDRELPGDDMEFGFPRDKDDGEARPENRAVAEFLASGAPFHLHASFHGIGFTSGPWFLIEPAWIERTAALRDILRERVRGMGYGLFDVDRGGDKGFRRIDEGFSTRPDSVSMKAYFLERNDPETAMKFRPSSMEYVRSLGGDPFTMVSEMPLFLRPPQETETGRQDDRYFRRELEKAALGKDAEEVRARAEQLGIRGMPIRDQMRLQLAFLNEALVAIET